MSSNLAVQSSDIAIAWVKALAVLTAPGVREAHPAVVSIAAFDNGFPSENSQIRSEVDQALSSSSLRKRVCSVETTANVIFPESLWARYRTSGRDVFFKHYLDLLPRLQQRDRRNHKGTYFSRFLRYGPHCLNQLAHVLDTWDRKNRRRSALQLCVFEPQEDHSNQPFLGFPCLDYITFTPNTTSGTLSVTALYAEQYLFDRGYGNYLGLCRLGRFVADQMDLRFNQLTCVASCMTLGEAIQKRSARVLVEKLAPAASEIS